MAIPRTTTLRLALPQIGQYRESSLRPTTLLAVLMLAYAVYRRFIP